METISNIAAALNSLQSVMAKFDKMRADTTAEQWEMFLDVPCISDFIDEIVELECILDKL